MCTRLYGESEAEDIVLVYDKEGDNFHAMDALCSHEGGPLDLGDIEEFSGSKCIVCPWHSYEFDLTTGYSQTTGLQVLVCYIQYPQSRGEVAATRSFKLHNIL